MSKMIRISFVHVIICACFCINVTPSFAEPKIGSCFGSVKFLKKTGGLQNWMYEYECSCAGQDGVTKVNVGPYSNDASAAADAQNTCETNCTITCTPGVNPPTKSQ